MKLLRAAENDCAPSRTCEATVASSDGCSAGPSSASVPVTDPTIGHGEPTSGTADRELVTPIRRAIDPSDMQRRWAAIYIAFFLVMAVSALSVMAVADEPTVSVEGDAYEDGDTFEVDGVTYQVAMEEGGSATLTYEEVTQQSESWDNESVVEYRNDTYGVIIPPEDDPDTFELVQQFDVEAILAADPAVENETITREDDREYVVYREDGRTEPLVDYLPEPDRQSFSEGDTLEHDGETKTVGEITDSDVTVEWEGPEEQEIKLSEGREETIGEDRQIVAHFPGDETVVLSENVEEYNRQSANQDYFGDRMKGLTFVVVISLVSVVLVAGLAFLPHRGG